MKYKKFAATALLAIAATGVSAGTAYAAPSPAAPATQHQAAAPTVTGRDQGVDYALTLADAGKSVVTSVTGGAFTLAADKQSVSLRNAAGETVTTIALTATAKGQQVRIAAAIADDAKRLTLTPKVEPSANAPVAAEFIGALIGLAVAGGPSLLNAGIAYFSGQL